MLAYDNRCWGDSGGLPRSEVDPMLQTRDYLDAFNYACSLPDVDPARVVYWGSSMSGGNAIVAASVNKALRGVVAQVPFASGERALAAGGGAQQTAMLVGERGGAALRGGAPALLPVFPRSAEELEAGSSSPAILRGPGVMRFKAELERGGHDADPVATVQSLTHAGLHEPAAFVHRVAPTPLLMLVADGDAVCGTSDQLAMYQRALEPKRLHVLRDAGHFDPYIGACFEENIKVQLEFLESVFA